MPVGELTVCAWPMRLPNNAFNGLLYGELQTLGVRVVPYRQPGILSERIDLLHVHWPDTYLQFRSSVRAWLRTSLELAVLRRLRKRGVKIVWTVHNLRSHERKHPRLDSWFWRQFPALADGFIMLAESTREPLLAQFPVLAAKPGFVIPHGHYRGAYPNQLSKAQARVDLDLPAEATVLTMLGVLRPYKNVPRLIECFSQLPDPNLRLLIAGLPGGGLAAETLRNAASGDARVRLHLERVPDEAIQRFLNAADLAPLPFVEILNSGSAILALSFDRPILVPNRGSMSELQSHVGLEFVRTFEGDINASILADALAWAKHPRAEDADLSALDWSRLASLTLQAYRHVLGRDGQTGGESR